MTSSYKDDCVRIHSWCVFVRALSKRIKTLPRIVHVRAIDAKYNTNSIDAKKAAAQNCFSAKIERNQFFKSQLILVHFCVKLQLWMRETEQCSNIWALFSTYYSVFHWKSEHLFEWLEKWMIVFHCQFKSLCKRFIHTLSLYLNSQSCYGRATDAWSSRHFRWRVCPPSASQTPINSQTDAPRCSVLDLARNSKHQHRAGNCGWLTSPRYVSCGWHWWPQQVGDTHTCMCTHAVRQRVITSRAKQQQKKWRRR